MSAQRLDYCIERQRHEGFVGRDAVLARLDQLLIGTTVDRWVVITGGPGMGKSALLAAWLARCEQAGDVVPHHFIRRGQYNWDDPATLVSSLVAQIEERFAGSREANADARIHPAARLAATLTRVSASELAPRGARLVVLVDSLDEYDPPAGAVVSDPLAAFLPHALPRGVSFLCACRPRHPYVTALAARGALVQIDLDGRDCAPDNAATVRAFWERAAPGLGLDARLVGEAIARAGGNLQHAAMLRQHLEGLAPEDRRVEDIPRGLAALLERSWERIANDPVAVEGLGILCAAREALTLDELGTVAGWTDDARRRAFVRGARELLIETRRPDGQEDYRLHHDAIRAHIAKALGAAALRGHHNALAHRLATWPTPAEATARRYALHHALLHRAEAGEWADLWRIAADTRFLETKCRELGVHEAEADVTRAAARCTTSSDDTLPRRLGELSRALLRESHWLRAAPEATAALLWNRLRRSGWTASAIDQQLQIPAEPAFLRVRHVATRESPALLRDLVGHSASVLACAVTADGGRAVSASADGTLKIWDTATGHALATLDGHANWVLACAVNADGGRMVSASADGTLKVWDTTTWRALVTLEGHRAPVRACAMNADGGRTVSASADGTLKVWDTATGRELTTLDGHAGQVLGCAVTANGERVVSASEDRTLKVWEAATGRTLATLRGHSASVRACAVIADGRRVVSASEDQTLKVWDATTATVLTTLRGHSAAVRACAVTADGRRVASASADGALKIWDTATGNALMTLHGHSAAVRACAMTADGGRVVSASADGTLKVWDTATEGALAAMEGHSASVRACAVSLDGRRVVSASADATLKVWDTVTGRALATLQGHSAWVRACVMTADGQRVASASEDGTLKVWDAATGSALATLQGHRAAVLACAVTSDGGRVISASEDGTLKVWHAATGRALATLHGHSASVRACAVLAGDGRVVSASADGTLKIWDIATGHALATLRGHSNWVHACAVTADGRRVVSASADGTLKIWDIATGHALATLRGHSGWVLACALTADGKRVVSASDDRTLRVWDTETGDALAVLKGHAGQVVACAMSADADTLISASDDWTLKVWDLKSYACILTHRGDTEYLAVTAAAGGVVAGDARGAVWFLDQPSANRRSLYSNEPAGAPRAHGDGVDPVLGGPARSVDIGILTIRDDELRAVLDAFPQKAGAGLHRGAGRQYILRHAEIATGERYTVAILRHLEEGTGEAQHAARDLIEDLGPRLVLVVGIASGLPSDDFTLGDVVLGTRIHDYTLEAVTAGHDTTYAVTGGPIDRAIAAAVAALPGREDELGDWRSGLPAQPTVAWTKQGQVYGPPEWQRELRAKLEHHHGEGSSRRPPIYVSGPIASSDRLVKDPRVLFPWITTARNLLAVEMESAGVYRAARERCPVLPIRGIRDIVGLSCSDSWTKYACAAAAAFARAFLRTRPVSVGASSR